MTRPRQALFAAAIGFAALSQAPAASALDEESDSEESPAEESESAEDEDEASEPAKADPEANEPGESPAEARETHDEPVPAPKAPRWARVWLGVAGSIDLVPMPSGSDLCKLSPSGAPANTVGVYCTNPDGSDFPSRASPAQSTALVDGAAGRLDGGFTDGNLRVLFAADYAPIPALLIGARIGYAFNGYSGNAVSNGNPWIHKNLHTELRLTYIFGSEPLTRVGFAPIAFLAGGASEFAAHVTRFVSLTGSGDQPVDMWIVRGPWFVAAGAGVRYQFSPRVAFTAALRVNTVFGEPSVLLTTGPDLGVSYGF